MSEGEPASDERRRFALFLVVLAALIAAWLGPALEGDLFVSTELVQRSVQPWSGLAPPPPVHNENLADPPTVWWPMQRFSAQLLRDWIAGGPPPLWCHESFAGAPWLGNPQAALCSPITWAFVVLPEVAAFALVAAAKWLLAGCGAWLLARRLGCSPLARGVAGIAFAFCGYQVVWIDSPLSNVSVVAPWLLLALSRLVERPTAGRTAVAALVSWQVVVGGHPETAFWVALLGAAWAAGEWLALREGRGRSLAALLVAALLAAALSVVQWWPFLEYALSSYGNELRRLTPNLLERPLGWRAPMWAAPFVFALFAHAQAYHAAAMAGDGLGPLRWRWWTVSFATLALVGVLLRREGLQATLLLQFVPDLFGRSLDGGVYDGPLTYADVVGGFCGAALGLVAFATALRNADDRRVVALVAGVALGACRLFRVGGVADLAESSATFATIGSSRALGVVALAIALLGAKGLDELRVAPRRVAAAMAVAAAFLVAIAATSIRPLAVERVALVADAGSVEAPARLRDGAPGSLGARFHGVAPAGAVEVRVVANGRPLDRVLLPEATRGQQEQGKTAFEWSWLGSARLDEGSFALRFEGVGADGTATPFAQVIRSTERELHFDRRVALHLAALLAVAGLALLGRGRAAALTLAAATLVELGFFGARYQATTPRDQIPGVVDPIPLLQRENAASGPWRLFTARTHLHPNLHLPFGLEVTRGYDALEPLAYIRLLDQLWRQGLVPWGEIDFSTVDFGGARGAAIADVLGIRWFLSEEPAPAGFVERWRRETLALWENVDALPRAFAVQRALPTRDVVAQGLDPRTAACWDDDQPAPRVADFTGSGRVVSLQHARGHLRAEVESDAGTIVVFSENFGGWRATLDGAPVAIERSHLALQSVVVPTGGRHVVEFRYLPRSVVAGASISAAALLAVALLLLRAARHRRSAPPATAAR